MTTYQFFTETTVRCVTQYILVFLPTVGNWLASRLDMIVFIHSFAWIFFLSSFLPSVILGKERGVLAQFALCLTLAFLAFIIQDVLTDMGFGALDQILGLAPLFQNPMLAITYLSVPYILMIAFDLQCRRKNDLVKMAEIESVDFPEDVFITEDDFLEEEKAQEEVYTNPN